MNNKMTQHNQPRERISLPATMVVLVVLFIGMFGQDVFLMNDAFREHYRSWDPNVTSLCFTAGRLCLVAVGGVVLVWTAEKRVRLGLFVGNTLILKGIMVGFVSSLPMLVYGLTLGIHNRDLMDLFRGSFVPGFEEELLYRAFGFGCLVLVAGWRMWPAAIATALLFGLAHIDTWEIPELGLVQAIKPELHPGLLIISAGGLFYSWIYARAPWNLWVVITLHALMNLWWELFGFGSSDVASSGTWITVTRVLSVGIAIYLVIFRGVLKGSKVDDGREQVANPGR